MYKRTAARIIAFAAAALTVLAVFAIGNARSAAYYRMKLAYTYERSLHELSEELSGMETALQKAEYAVGSQMLERLAMELTSGSGAAKSAMEALPFADNRMERVTRFLSQVGDYALALSAKGTAGGEISAQDMEQLLTMTQYAGTLRQAFSEVETALSENKIQLEHAEKILANLSDEHSLPAFDSNLDTLAETFSSYPELLYDGPFSDHVNQKEAAFTKGKDEVSTKDARGTAAALMGYEERYITETGTTENSLPTLNFTCVDKAVRVAKYGGDVVSYEHYIVPAETRLFYEEVLPLARDFLQNMGMEHVKESYYVTGGNICTINFAWTEPADSEGYDEIICYPDLIKVSVSLETGEITGYNATGFFMNHHTRVLSTPALTREEAAEKVSTRLEIQKTALAVIPSPGLHERFCYEFTCRNSSGQDVLVYINAETGATEQIYLVLKSDGGVLVQ